ncbi:carbohydrate ABC transporter permease [Jiangella ureilytica]|uniref:Carbohydrate ABC transporter permease n=2 Tax=Jiangella ureilytica TaxID=2530374 RepID=A0A4V2XW66_9ACTN|nr:carbohydrate ABC transporter permease [Jiangella ureilytica]
MVAVLFASPLIAVLLGSFKSPAEAARTPPTYVPDEPSLRNYTALQDSSAGVWTAIGNSALVAAGSVVLTVVLALLAAYGFERYRFRGSEAVFVLMLAAIMVPFQILVSPLYVVLNALGLTNSLVGIVLVITTFQLPFSVFVIRNSFAAIPGELYEAAAVDGAGLWRTLRALAPLLRAGLITAALFTFFAAWNEFFAALILLADQDRFTLPVVLTTLISGARGSVDWGLLQSGVIVTVLPCVVIFIVLQKYYVSGMTAGAGK